MSSLNSEYYPKLYGYGQRGDSYYLLSSLHGNASECLKQIYGTDANYNLVFSMGIQIIEALEQLHSAGYVHCDIKPQNILLKDRYRLKANSTNWNSAEKLVLIDFENCVKYVDSNSEHVKMHKSDHFRGTIEYAAIDCLNG